MPSMVLNKLQSLLSRMCIRLVSECADREELMACLRPLLVTTVNPMLMTEELKQTMCDHAF
ncbi:MAG: hypothetical protein ACI8UP_001809 [Porticoccaceae bacterium]|jgi:hypothetical protein